MSHVSATRVTTHALESAVHRNAALSRKGILERLFTLVFRGLVYPQIWEDPVVDMAALALRPSDHVVAIASGGCNVMSYLTADPARITALDLNGAHVALTKLKLAAARNLPDHESFFRLFGKADSRRNIIAYESHLRSSLAPDARAYWDKRTATGRRRIGLFARGLYRYGLLGRCIGAGHWLARLHGINPALILQAQNRLEQRHFFDQQLAPMFEKPLLRWLLRQPASLYGLGIPPRQFVALANDSGQSMAAIVRQRLERLACNFDLASNYFAWQAFGRRYAPGAAPAVPPYLERPAFDLLKARADRVDVRHQSVTAFLKASPAASVDAFVLLDAQDWMTDADLVELWSEITRTARPGARVIFRTAADERLLPGRIPDDLLNAWFYDLTRSRAFTGQDRSAIYGGFHLYVRRDRQL